MGGTTAPELLPDTPFGEALRTIAAVRFRELNAFLRHPEPGRPDFVHDTRIAARRLYTLLAVFKNRFHRGRQFKDFACALRELCRALGLVREYDVSAALVRGSVRVDVATALFAARLAAAGAAARRELVPVMKRCATPGFSEDFNRDILGALQRNGRSKTFSRIMRRTAAELSRSFLRNRWSPDPAALHSLRKTGKKLRYTLESAATVMGTSFRKRLRAVKGFVGLLGEIHDLDVILAAARRYREELRLFNRTGRPRLALARFEAMVHGFERRRAQLAARSAATFNRWRASTL